YRMAEVSPEWTVATAVHGAPFTAAIQRGNLFGTQFHPEKSGEIGLAMLRNFVQWKGACVPC
ncbi:MAG: imidazole glycerol phosphate synthase subunit HisH, partial [Clostridia bacterium]